MRFTKCIVMCLMIGLVSPVAMAGPAVDTVVVVDESGSMSGEIAWLPYMVSQLEANLIAKGYGVGGDINRYGLVGFGRSSDATPHQVNVGGGQFGTAAEFGTAVGSLETTGGLQDGWEAIVFALNYNFRLGVPVNIILVTDEDRDTLPGSTLTRNDVLAHLDARRALLNVIVNYGFEDGATPPNAALGVDRNGIAYLADGAGGFTTSPGGVATTGHGTAFQDYIQTAWLTSMGGAAWNLNYIEGDPVDAESFTKAFVEIKVGEIRIPAVSEWGLVVIALLLLTGAKIYFGQRQRVLT